MLRLKASVFATTWIFDGPLSGYCALGTAEQIAQNLQEFYEAGVRYVILDLVGPYEERLDHLAAFADEVLPLIGEMIP